MGKSRLVNSTLVRCGALVIAGALTAVPLRGSSQEVEKTPASDTSGAADTSGKTESKVKAVTADKLDNAILNAPNQVVVVYFEGKECSSCGRHLKMIERIAKLEKYGDKASFISVFLSDKDAWNYGVTNGFPTVAFYKPEGKVARKRVAMLFPDMLNENDFMSKLEELTTSSETK
jgi:hypothetical protein